MFVVSNNFVCNEPSDNRWNRITDLSRGALFGTEKVVPIGEALQSRTFS